MKHIWRILNICALLLMTAQLCSAANEQTKVVLLVPIQHRAMDEIVRGVQENLKESNNKVIVFNAMGDPTNLNAIVHQVAQHSEYNFIMPIGTTASYLALGATKDKNIISLASTIDEKTREKLMKKGHLNFTNIYDEMKSHDILSFISKLSRKKILLVHSNDEKIHKEVAAIDNVKAAYDIEVKKFVVTNSADIYSIDAALQDVDSVLLLKDHLVVSMIGVITSAAHQYAIPVISCDEGSVLAGADAGIGVEEYDIGRAGAEVLKEVVSGKKITDISVKELSNIKVFYHDNVENHIDLEDLKSVSNELQHDLKIVKQ